MTETLEQIVTNLREQTDGLSAEDLIAAVWQRFDGKIALATSLGAEDQVLTHMLHQRVERPVLFTLDTGRLPQETYDVMQATRRRYGVNIEVMFPDFELVQDMVKTHGPNLFYESVELRKRCCYVRKIEPLKRALTGLETWICGLRRGQSTTRTTLERIDVDEQFGLIKIAPLADWSTEQVWDYIKAHEVPYNTLHDRGYPSIGCAPCTRAVPDGLDIRAGRWWWEAPEHKECGLHLRPDGTLGPKV